MSFLCCCRGSSLRNYLLERRIGCSEDLVDDLISQVRFHLRNQGADEDDLELLSKLEHVEDKLITWLTVLATREAEMKGYVPSDSEVSWIIRISRFYDVYVQYLQNRYRRISTPEYHPPEAFVSHTWTDKNSYALPLAHFLKRNNVSTFLDVDDIPLGSSGRHAILSAATTCRYFWCVLSKGFVQRKWPMRELMIGYARYVRESGSGFTLILDCLEHGPRPYGLWMDHVLNMKSLKLYDEHGFPQPFPGNMQRAREESFDDRIARVAALAVELGTHVCQGSNAENTATLLGRALSSLVQVDQFPIESFRRKIENCRQVRILTTWISYLGELQDVLVDALSSGAFLDILLLSPESPLSEARNRALEASPRANIPVLPEHLQDGIAWNMQMVKCICTESARLGGPSVHQRVRVRFYNSLPSISMYQADDTAYIGLFFHGRLSEQCPHVEVDGDSFLQRGALKEFDILWDCAVPALLLNV